MRNLFPFHLGNVIRKLNQIRIAINLQHQKPFPKSKSRLLSHYSFVSRRIKINPSGEIAGGLSRFVTSLIDFSFVRSICASAYSSRGGHAYDPVSLPWSGLIDFLLELFRYLEKFPDLKTFLSTVRDQEKGKHYRLPACGRQVCRYLSFSYPKGCRFHSSQRSLRRSPLYRNLSGPG